MTCELCDRPAKSLGLCSRHYQQYWKGKLLYEPQGRQRHRDYGAKMAKFTERNAGTGCLEWTGTRTPDGYGLVKDGGQQGTAHRWVYEHEVGPISESHEIDHLCRVRHCVEPTHLEPVLPAENHRRGLLPYTIRTMCRKGLHDITQPEAWYVHKGKRTCLECRRESARKYRSR
jgi:hypothetical protein